MKLSTGRRILLNAEWYLVLEFVDKGNFARVYKVLKSSTDEVFALKIMELKYTNRCFNKEVECMKALDHPNVVKFHDSGVLLGIRFILMEYVDGIDLYKWVVKHPKIEEDQFICIITQLLDTLDYIHSNNIVHRDVKTENVLCTDSEYPKIKITDFGLAAIVNGNLLNDFCGSPFYVAPEVLERRPYSFEVDTWGLGIVAYILQLGFFPIYIEEGDCEKILEIIKAEKYFDQDYFEDLSNPVQVFLKGLLTRDPGKRFTITEAKKILAQKIKS